MPQPASLNARPTLALPSRESHGVGSQAFRPGETDMVEATNLARWVLRHSGRPVSHLKLQKLAFYCFGAASAYDLDTLIGDVRFEAWEHGPVNRSVYNEYKAFGATPIDPPSTCVEYPAEVTRVLADSLAIYGSLDAWSLRQQSHLEEPWIASWKT